MKMIADRTETAHTFHKICDSGPLWLLAILKSCNVLKSRTNFSITSTLQPGLKHALALLFGVDFSLHEYLFLQMFGDQDVTF